MAEKERFELSNGFTRYTISSRAPSTKLGDFSTIGTSSARQQGIVYHNIYDSSRGKTRFFSITQTAATAAFSPDAADISSRHGHHPQSTGGCGGTILPEAGSIPTGRRSAVLPGYPSSPPIAPSARFGRCNASIIRLILSL